MDNEKIQELLLQLVQDMAYVKTKLNSLDEQKLASRIDYLEAVTSERVKLIDNLENRIAIIENNARTSLEESKRNNVSIWLSVGIAILSTILSIIANLI